MTRTGTASRIEPAVGARTWLLAFGLATAIAFAMTVQAWYASAGTHRSWSFILQGQLIRSFAWALIAPVVIAVLRRSTARARSSTFLILFYAGAGVVTVLLWATLTGLGIALWWSFPSLIPDQLFWHTSFELQHKTVLAALVFALIAVASRPRHARLLEQPPEPTAAVRPPPVLALRTSQRVVFVAPAEIDWLEADRDHVVVHARGGMHRVRDRLSNLEQRLSSDRFIRVSRSAIVNVGAIAELQPWFRGDFMVILRSGAKVQTGRTYRDRITRLIQ